MEISYFAYGSNMSSKRLEDERKVHFTEKVGASLKDYELIFNKISATNPAVAVANIQTKPGDEVRGVLYTIDSEDAKIIDKYERAPEHYQRIDVRVERLDTKEQVNAFTYKATVAHTFKSGGHPVNQGYMDYLLHAQDLLGQDWVTRMAPAPQKFKFEMKNNILDFNEYLKEARMTKELLTFVGANVDEPILGLLDSSNDRAKYLKLLKDGYLKIVAPPKHREAESKGRTWFALTQRGKDACEDYINKNSKY